MKEEVTGSERIYDGKVISLRVDTVRFDNGDIGKREVIEHNGAVALVVMPDEDHVILVTQYRAAAGKYLLEVPAGSIEPGESPEAAARREIVEETNLEARSMERLFGIYSAPGFTTEYLTVYLATELTQRQGTPDQDEFLDVSTVLLTDAIDKIESGEIEDAKSVAGLLAVARRKGL